MSLSYSGGSAVRRPYAALRAHFTDGGLPSMVPIGERAPGWEGLAPTAAVILRPVPTEAAPAPILAPATGSGPGSGPALPATMSQALRGPLHELLGHAQLLRLEGGLAPAQSHHVDAVLAAGRHLLDQLEQAFSAEGARALDPRDPAADAEDIVPADACAVVAPPQGRALHVLIVDDAMVSRDIAAAFLRTAGHQVTLLENGRDAVSAVARTDFDVVLMDLRMPGLDGLDATRRIRDLGGARSQVPILALTALAFTEDAEACREAGMNGHLAKPFRYDTLCEAVRRAARGAGAGGWAEGGQAAPGHGKLTLSLSARTLHPGGTLTPEHGAGLAWMNIANPWNRIPVGQHAAPPHAMPALPGDLPFKLTLTAVGTAEKRRLVDKRLFCEPPHGQEGYEFHWLVFVKPDFGAIRAFNTTCDLWRWNERNWRSVAVPGAQFSPEEMHDQGWRYCGPCADKIATIEVSAGNLN